MGTEKEAALPIEDFGGVNLNPDSEDLQPNQLLAATNLWEKTLGVLETRPGSDTVMYKPTGVVDYKLNNLFKIYKSSGDKKRFVAAQMTADVQVLSSLPTGCSLSLVTDSTAFWNDDITLFTIDYNTEHRRVNLRFLGYGVDYIYQTDLAALSGYAASTKQKLRVTLTSSFDNSKITCIEVYATVMTGTTVAPATVTSVSTYQQQTLWCGYIDVSTTVAQTKDFRYTPVGYKATIAAGTTLGATERTFSVTPYESGNNGITGTFVGGKTYYVAILQQYTVFDTGSASRCLYRNNTVDVYGGNIAAVTIPGTTTGHITINTISPNTQCFLVAIGDTPQTLQPVCIFNDSSLGGSDSISGTPNVIAAGDFFVGAPPSRNPGLIDIRYTADGIADLCFRFSDISHDDMLIGITDADVKYPIFCSRLTNHAGDKTQWQDWLNAGANPSSAPTSSTGASKYPWFWYGVNAINQCPKMGKGSRYHFIPWDDYALFVNDHDPLSNVPITISTVTYQPIPHRTSTNYYVCDGNIAGTVIQDYQATALTLPNMKYIAKFDSSVVLGGGTANIDPVTGLRNTSAKTLYFSRAVNPFDFTIAGAASTTHQTILVDDDGDDISGFGIYTNTTAREGPQSQLVTAKKNACWILNKFPTFSSSGVLDVTSVTSRLLSRKVGGFHLTFVNTPIGLIMASSDNVYLVREDGEPTPIGQNISPLLKAANMNTAVACYHDKHYKLSFSHPDYSGYNSGNSNNVEMWLNINKMIETKGTEDWVGPMTGRCVDFVFVEDKITDGTIYNSTRTRYAVDKYDTLGRIYKADSLPADSDDTVYDKVTADDGSNVAVTATITTKDFDISQQDNNWMKLLKRFYVKLRTNWTATSAAYATHTVYADGVAQTTTNFGTDITASSGSLYSKPLTLIRLFPTGRLRGRTFKFSFTFTKRVAIGGLQLNYEVERRRI